MNVEVDTRHDGLLRFDAANCEVGQTGELVIKHLSGITFTVFAAGEWTKAALDEGTPSARAPLTPQQMLAEFHDTFGNVDDDELRLKLLKEEMKELKEAMEANDLVEIADAVADICYVAVGTAHVKGIPFDKVFAEVHRSNMTKLGEDGKPVKRADGKIIKGPNYEKPQIKPILDASVYLP